MILYLLYYNYSGTVFEEIIFLDGPGLSELCSFWTGVNILPAGSGQLSIL